MKKAPPGNQIAANPGRRLHQLVWTRHSNAASKGSHCLPSERAAGEQANELSHRYTSAAQ
jgi:hypothetical protein